QTMAATTLAANTSTPGNTVELGSLSGDTLYTSDLTGLSSLQVANTMVSANTGGNQPHENCMPSLTVRYCICWNGVYPSQS
ncbi:phage tail protein, partial [Salmonella enterica]|uniref:phage tail protein n=1 Tax=Salmonella enterica TaxID=28901 RepID=UPI0021B1AD45